MNKIKEIFGKSREAVMYLIFGILTTLVDYIAAMCCFGLLELGELTSNNIAWVVSVLFAFITNKLFVFDSKSFEWRVLMKELVSFVSARVITLLMADFIIWSAAMLGIGFLFAKIVSSVVVVVVNYIFSKLIIFKKINQEEV